MLMQDGRRRATHTVPTHMNVPDKVLTLGPLSLTARQFLLFLVGSSVSYNLWHKLLMLSAYGPSGQLLRLCLSLLPVVVALTLALVQHAGRPLEVWCIVLVHYWYSSRRYVWRTVRDVHEEETAMPDEEEEVSLMREPRESE